MRQKGDLELLHQYQINPSRRLLQLFDDITMETVRTTASNLLTLDHTDGPITLLLNTPGGEWYAGMALYDLIRACKNHITILATGHVMSMGTVIMQAADERLVTPHCQLMIHYGNDGYEGEVRNFVAAGRESARQMKQMEDIYLARMKEKNSAYKPSQLRRLMELDQYMEAERFVALGLADKVVGN